MSIGKKNINLRLFASNSPKNEESVEIESIKNY